MPILMGTFLLQTTMLLLRQYLASTHTFRQYQVDSVGFVVKKRAYEMGSEKLLGEGIGGKGERVDLTKA